MNILKAKSELKLCRKLSKRAKLSPKTLVGLKTAVVSGRQTFPPLSWVFGALYGSEALSHAPP